MLHLGFTDARGSDKKNRFQNPWPENGLQSGSRTHPQPAETPDMCVQQVATLSLSISPNLLPLSSFQWVKSISCAILPVILLDDLDVWAQLELQRQIQDIVSRFCRL